MVLGKDAHKMELDLLCSRHVIKVYYEIVNNTINLSKTSELTNSVFLTGFNGIVWF